MAPGLDNTFVLTYHTYIHTIVQVHTLLTTLNPEVASLVCTHPGTKSACTSVWDLHGLPEQQHVPSACVKLQAGDYYRDLRASIHWVRASIIHWRKCAACWFHYVIVDVLGLI